MRCADTKPGLLRGPQAVESPAVEGRAKGILQGMNLSPDCLMQLTLAASYGWPAVYGLLDMDEGVVQGAE